MVPALMSGINEFNERFGITQTIHVANPIDPSELTQVIEDVKLLCNKKKVAVFVFLIGYFKPPHSLLLPHSDYVTGHYKTYDISAFARLQ
jgi:hypothetical protein